MSWLALFFALELAVLPNGFIQTYDTDLVHESLIGDGLVKMEAEATLFDYFFVGGEMDCYLKVQDGDNPFFPVDMFYAFSAGARFDFLEIGFRHYCMHPIVPFLYHAEVSPQWEGSYEEIYLRVEVRK